MAYTALPTKNPGDLLTSALWNTYLQGNADSGFLRMIADVTLVAPGATVAFSSIPATFAHLLVVFNVRGDTAATNTNLLAQFNGDGAANYDYELLQASGTTTTAAQGQAQTSMLAALMTASTAPASVGSGGVLFIPGYAGTTFQKHLLALSNMKQGTGLAMQFISMASGFWRNTAALSTLTFLPAAGNFIAGSRFTLYGLPQ